MVFEFKYKSEKSYEQYHKLIQGHIQHFYEILYKKFHKIFVIFFLKLKIYIAKILSFFII